VLIKRNEIIGIWNTEETARAVATSKYPMQPCLIHQVRSREPVVPMSARFWDVNNRSAQNKVRRVRGSGPRSG
jgi:hypothetical protein